MILRSEVRPSTSSSPSISDLPPTLDRMPPQQTQDLTVNQVNQLNPNRKEEDGHLASIRQLNSLNINKEKTKKKLDRANQVNN